MKHRKYSVVKNEKHRNEGHELQLFHYLLVFKKIDDVYRVIIHVPFCEFAMSVFL